MSLTCAVQFSGPCGASSWRGSIIRDYWTTCRCCKNIGVTRAHTHTHFIWYLMVFLMIMITYCTLSDHITHILQSDSHSLCLFFLLAVVFFLALSAFSEAEHHNFLFSGYSACLCHGGVTAWQQSPPLIKTTAWLLLLLLLRRGGELSVSLCLPESRSKPTASEPAAQHLDGLKHICQTHSR